MTTLLAPAAVDPLDHQGLVWSIACSYLPRAAGLGLGLEDLVAHGQVGLLTACRKFDPERGNGFSTYATPCIVRAIGEAIDAHAFPVRVPRGTATEARRVMDGAATLDTRTATAAYRIAAAMRVLDAVRDDHALEDLPGDAGPEGEALDVREAWRAVEAALRTLPRRQAEVIRWRYGLGGGMPESLAAIGVRLGLTKERVRQLEMQAIRTLRRRVGRSE